jgi:hypothetical protein
MQACRVACSSHRGLLHELEIRADALARSVKENVTRIIVRGQDGNNPYRNMLTEI